MQRRVNVDATSCARRDIYFTEEAYVWSLEKEYTFDIGSTLDIVCRADGYPAPIYWWTKESDENFERSGERLIEERVQVKLLPIKK